MIGKIDKLTQKIATEQLTCTDGLCTRQRNKDNKCNLCIDACPSEAIKMEWKDEKGYTPVIDFNACVTCGACAAVCPTGVYEMVEEPDDKIFRYVDKTKEQISTYRFVCELAEDLREVPDDAKAITARQKEMAKWRKERPKENIYLPCVARANDTLLVGMAARGAKNIELDSSKCADCPVNTVVPIIEKNVEMTSRFLGLYGSDSAISYSDIDANTSLLSEEIKKDKKKAPNFETFDKVTRRSFLKKARTQTLSMGAQALDESLPDFFKSPEELEPEGLIYELAPKRRRLLDAIKMLPGPVRDLEPVEGLPVSSFDINANCTGCRWCATYCPTGAFKSHADGSLGSIQFTVGHCVGCDLCVEICYDKAIDRKESFATAAFAAEETEDLVTQKVYRCTECKQDFYSMHFAERCNICDKKHKIFGEVDGEFSWDQDLKIG